MRRLASPNPRARRFVATTEDAGQRIDRVIARHDQSVSRATARRLFEAGRVWRNGKVARKADLVQKGDQVVFDAPQAAFAEADDATALDIVQQTRDWVVVRKPSGLPSVALRGKPRHNVASALLSRFPEMGRLPSPKTDAGLVHRLDTGASGLMLAARTCSAWHSLIEARTSGLLTREYFALVSPANVLSQGEIDRPLFSNPKSRRKVSVRRTGSRPGDRAAVTGYELLQRGPRRALLCVTAPRAHRHQIRAHLSFIGHAIVNDTLYGGEHELKLEPGFALHSSYIGYRCAGVAPLSARDAVPELFERLVGE